MNRNTRTLVVVGLAIVLASLASYGVYRAITGIPVVHVPIAERFVVVAAQNVTVGGVLGPEQVKVVAWPANAAVPNSFGKVEEVVGRGVVADVLENEPITEGKLAPKGGGAGLIPTITPGMRAISVRVNSVVAPVWTAANTFVDVIVTVNTGQEIISQTVLSAVKVLAANADNTDQRRQQGQTAETSIVTLLLTPEDSERLTLATSQGGITLALRNPLDTAQTKTSGARMRNLIGGTVPPPVVTTSPGGQRRVVAPPPPAPPPPPMTIEIISGNDRKTQPVKPPVKPPCCS
jgi:pilus assembly protein CpaB